MLSKGHRASEESYMRQMWKIKSKYEIKSEDVYEEFLSTNICLTLVTIQKIQKFVDETNKEIICKMKDVPEGKINDEFVGLKSKMHSGKNIYDEETNTAKGVHIATEFNEFKNTLFNEKIIRHKIIRI